jgi:hypothetical protein
MGARIPKPSPGRQTKKAETPIAASRSSTLGPVASTETVESLRRRLEIAIRGLNAVASIASSDSYTNRSRADQMESILRVVERAKADVTAGINGQERGA